MKIKAKEGKKIVGVFGTMAEAAEAMVAAGAANTTAAKWNINAALNGTEGRKSDSVHHFNGQPRKTAYGLTWYTTKR